MKHEAEFTVHEMQIPKWISFEDTEKSVPFVSL